MEIIPAINIKNKKIYLPDLEEAKLSPLFQGVTDPIQAAHLLVEEGAPRLYIIDLDGAFAGKPIHLELIARLAQEVAVPIFVGGGIRQLNDIHFYLGKGVSKIVLGTVAAKYPTSIYQLIRNFGSDRIIVSVDVKGDKIRFGSWKEALDMDVTVFIKNMENQGVKRIIYTDIERVNTMQGVNYSKIKTIAKLTRVMLTIAGGVQSDTDLVQIMKLTRYNVDSVIIGKAVYTSGFKLKKKARKLLKWTRQFD